MFLSHSPDAHHNLLGTAPGLCSGLHQKGCDLEGVEGAGLEFDQDYPAFKFEFNSNPETLSPLNIDTAVATDAYQQQDAPGADLIGGAANQGMDPYQAKEERYEVLA